MTDNDRMPDHLGTLVAARWAALVNPIWDRFVHVLAGTPRRFRITMGVIGLELVALSVAARSAAPLMLAVIVWFGARWFSR